MSLASLGKKLAAKIVDLKANQHDNDSNSKISTAAASSSSSSSAPGAAAGAAAAAAAKNPPILRTNRVENQRKTTIIKATTTPTPTSSLFAVTGPDGAGKSHIASYLMQDELKSLRESFGFRAEQTILEHNSARSRMPAHRLYARRGIVGVIVVFDITSRESFNELGGYIFRIGGPFVIVANKCDLVENIAISQEEIENTERKFGTKIFPVGIGLETNLIQALGYLINRILSPDTRFPNISLIPKKGAKKILEYLLFENPLADVLGGGGGGGFDKVCGEGIKERKGEGNEKMKNEGGKNENPK